MKGEGLKEAMAVSSRWWKGWLLWSSGMGGGGGTGVCGVQGWEEEEGKRGFRGESGFGFWRGGYIRWGGLDWTGGRGLAAEVDLGGCFGG